MIIENSAEKLKGTFQELIEACKSADLETNQEKTFILTNGFQAEIEINGLPVKYVEEVTYVRQSITFKGTMEKELAKRISSNWKNF